MKLKPLSLFLLALTVPCFLQSGLATDEVGEGGIQASLQPRCVHGLLSCAKLCFPRGLLLPSSAVNTCGIVYVGRSRHLAVEAKMQSYPPPRAMHSIALSAHGAT